MKTERKRNKGNPTLSMVFLQSFRFSVFLGKIFCFVCGENCLQLIVVCMRGVGKICAEGGESNGKTEKVAEIVDTQGFAFSVFHSVFHSVFPFRFSVLMVGKLSCVRACFPFSLPYPLPPYPVGCLTLQDGM
jgi:hypothetical protein